MLRGLGPEPPTGLYHAHGSPLYVNRGIGTIGVPIRLGSPPEVAILELVGET